MRHVLISVDDIQSQKSLQTGHCKGAAPVLPGSATPGTQWSGTRGTLTSGSQAAPSPAPSLEAVPSKATWQHTRETLTRSLLQGSAACSVLAFVLLGTIKLICWPVPSPLLMFGYQWAHQILSPNPDSIKGQMG